jgi:DivIVA domain-containing protein
MRRMDNAETTSSVLETLRTVEFRLGLKGYNVDEVDEYLEKAAVEAEGLRDQVRQANDRLRLAADRIKSLESGRAPAASAAAAPSAPAPAPAAASPSALAASDDALRETLEMARNFVAQVKTESEAEARKLVASAEERARQLTSEAQQRLRDEVQRLEGIKARLATDVRTMSQHLDNERTRLRSALGDVLTWIDSNLAANGASADLDEPTAPHSTESSSGAAQDARLLAFPDSANPPATPGS